MLKRKYFNCEKKFNIIRRKINHKTNCYIRIERKKFIIFLNDIFTSSNFVHDENNNDFNNFALKNDIVEFAKIFKITKYENNTN